MSNMNPLALRMLSLMSGAPAANSSANPLVQALQLFSALASARTDAMTEAPPAMSTAATVQTPSRTVDAWPNMLAGGRINLATDIKGDIFKPFLPRPVGVPVDLNNLQPAPGQPQERLIGLFDFFRDGVGAVSYAIGENGRLYRIENRQLFEAGRVESNGNFTITDDNPVSNKSGNIFADDLIGPSVRFAQGAEFVPFARNLMFARRQNGQQNDFVAQVRRDIANMRDSRGNPLDGRGVNVLAIEGGLDDPQNTHPRQVADIISGQRRGIAPGANTRLVDFRLAVSNIENNAESLEGFMDSLSTAPLDGIAESIERAIASNDRPRVINISQGLSNARMYGFIERQLRQARANGEPLTAWEQAIFGGDPSNLSETDRFNRIKTYVDNRLANSTDFQRSLQRYQQTTERAAAAGTTIVVAGGNEGIARPAGVQFNNGEALNFLARGRVITVAASDPNEDPDVLGNDTVANFSSPGDSRLTPTLAAPGRAVPNDITIDPIAGTSFSAPMVSGTIALMLQKNPNLTFDQIRDILTRTATDTGASSEQEGAGMLDPARALRETPEPTGAPASFEPPGTAAAETFTISGTLRTVAAGSGADNVTVNGNRNAVYLGDGNDQGRIDASDSTLEGGLGNDVLTVNGQNNLVTGDDGDDRFTVAGGRDNTLDGGAGNDTAVFAGPRQNYTVTDENGGRSVVDRAGNRFFLRNIENLIFDEALTPAPTPVPTPAPTPAPPGEQVIAENNRTLSFFNGIQRLRVDGQSNLIQTGDSDDQIRLFGGDNQLLTGAGNDRVEIFSSNNRVILGAGNDQVFVRAGSQNTIQGGDGNDTVTFQGRASDYRTIRFGNITLVFDSQGGTTFLQGIETINYTEA